MKIKRITSTVTVESFYDDEIEGMRERAVKVLYERFRNTPLETFVDRISVFNGAPEEFLRETYLTKEERKKYDTRIFSPSVFGFERHPTSTARVSLYINQKWSIKYSPSSKNFTISKAPSNVPLFKGIINSNAEAKLILKAIGFFLEESPGEVIKYGQKMLRKKNGDANG